MSAISNYPLHWPLGWKRTPPESRKRGRFTKGERHYPASGGSFMRHRDLTFNDGVKRVLEELSRIGVDRDDVVISTNVAVRLDGLSRSGQREPDDPGCAVYWTQGTATRVMAIDLYTTAADNLAAIAATLDAMRAIERHGGAAILDRAFTGFTALPSPDAIRHWRDVLGPCATLEEARAAYRRAAAVAHPDRGGSDVQMAEINRAWQQAQEDLR